MHNTINVADDIVLAGCGNTDEEAKTNLERRTKALKERCTQKGIILNNTKTVSAKKKIVFMGHMVTASGISPDLAKIDAIQNWPTPTDVSAVRRLCRTVQYLSRYTPNLSHDMEPLRALARKNAVFNWS